MSDLLAARAQMAMSLAFHIVFAAIGIAMPAASFAPARAARINVIPTTRPSVTHLSCCFCTPAFVDR